MNRCKTIRGTCVYKNVVRSCLLVLQFFQWCYVCSLHYCLFFSQFTVGDEIPPVFWLPDEWRKLTHDNCLPAHGWTRGYHGQGRCSVTKAFSCVADATLDHGFFPSSCSVPSYVCGCVIVIFILNFRRRRTCITHERRCSSAVSPWELCFAAMPRPREPTWRRHRFT